MTIDTGNVAQLEQAWSFRLRPEGGAAPLRERGGWQRQRSKNRGQAASHAYFSLQVATKLTAWRSQRKVVQKLIVCWINLIDVGTR